MTRQEYMDAFKAAYKVIIGRNYYSQSLRSYVYTAKGGKYYSDCSSSVTAALKKIGLTVKYSGSTLPNTCGIYKSADMVDVPVKISKGVIQNPEVLQVGDLLLFAGTDKTRSWAGYVGHVEAVYTINKDTGKITICGHGSAHPRTTELNAYCKSRYGKKTSTPVGHKGLVKVRRHKLIAGIEQEHTQEANELRRGDTGEMVRHMQRALMAAGYSLPSYGDDGDFGAETEAAVKAFQRAHGLIADGIADSATLDLLNATTDKYIRIIGRTVNIRSAPGVNAQKIGVAKHYDKLPYQGISQIVDGTIWYLIEWENGNAWVSSRYAETEEGA